MKRLFALCAIGFALASCNNQPQAGVNSASVTDSTAVPGNGTPGGEGAGGAGKDAMPTVCNNEDDARRRLHGGADSALYATGILPRMLEEVPEYAIRLLNEATNGFIVVDKFRMLVILYDSHGNVRKEYPMACAKNYGNKQRRADSRTPEGYFNVLGVFNSTDWLFTDDNGVTSPVKGQFGPRFIRIAPQIGIHGTCNPGSIGGRRSHGCIRIKNENILELAELVEEGMPVIVSPGARDMAVNESEGCPVPAITTGTTRPTPAKYDPTLAKPAQLEAEKAESEPEDAESVQEPANEPASTDTVAQQ